MSDAPAMPVFPDAYLADTTHLTTEEHGAYLLLLMAMWRRNGVVPNDDKDLARIVGLDISRWRKTKRRLLSLLTVDSECLTQKRLLKEWQYVQEKRNKNAANGSRGGRPKSNINSRLVKANGYENNNPNESPHNPEPIPIEKPSGFSERASAQKGSPRGWVQIRKSSDAAASLIEDIERHDEGRTQNGNALPGDALRLVSAVGGK